MLYLISTSDNLRLLSILVDSLKSLAFKHNVTKQIILKSDGPRILIDILNKNHGDYSTLLQKTGGLIKCMFS